MKILIFAGGTGTRLWPLSRKNSPKQFDKLIDNQSTLQQAVNRVREVYGLYNIYIQTNEQYVSVIKEQVPDLPLSNIFAEPAKRDLAPAVGFALMKLKKQKISEPISILWSDHLMNNVENFQQALRVGEELILKNPNRFVFFAEKPRYPEQNLGWINIGKEIDRINDIPILRFKKWRYRPSFSECKKMFTSGNWLWNPGYWVTSIDYVLELYKQFQPQMYKQLKKISDYFDTGQESEIVSKIYPTLEKIHFDDAILTHVENTSAVVLKLNMGWSDPGTLYALKEALQKTHKANVERGKVLYLDCKDSLIFNQEPEKLITAVGLDGFVIVNTSDATIVVHKDNVPKVKKIVEEIEKNKNLAKYA